eukprot:scaffold107072_cov48-Phaeocystis_antarctica.AAC.2
MLTVAAPSSYTRLSRDYYLLHGTPTMIKLDNLSRDMLPEPPLQAHLELHALPDVLTYDHADERHAARPLAERLAGADAEAPPRAPPTRNTSLDTPLAPSTPAAP